MSTHVEHSEVDFGFGEGFDLKSDSSRQLGLLVLFGLEEVDHSRLARVIKADNDNFALLVGFKDVPHLI